MLQLVTLAALSVLDMNGRKWQDCHMARTHPYGEFVGHTMVPVSFAYVYSLVLISLGNAVASTGDSGNVHLWKRDLSGKFVEFAETGPS